MMDDKFRPFRDDPVAQGYLFYIQKMLADGAKRKDIATPGEFWANSSRGDIKESELNKIESTDPSYKALERIYNLLGGMP